MLESFLLIIVLIISLKINSKKKKLNSQGASLLSWYAFAKLKCNISENALVMPHVGQGLPNVFI